jgi:hypothetical protein
MLAWNGAGGAVGKRSDCKVLVRTARGQMGMIDLTCNPGYSGGGSKFQGSPDFENLSEK